MLERAGINTEIFKAHSVRSASASAATGAGLTTSDILNAADWSTESVVRKFYYKPAHNPASDKPFSPRARNHRATNITLI